MNYFENILNHIYENQTEFWCGDVRIETLELKTIAHLPNGTRCEISHGPYKNRNELVLPVVYKRFDEKEHLLAPIEVTLWSIRELAANTGLYDMEEPLTQAFLHAVRRVRCSNGVLKFHAEYSTGPTYIVNALTPIEASQMQRLTFDERYRFEPTYSDPDSLHPEFLSSVTTGDPGVMKTIRAEAKRIQQQLQNSVAFRANCRAARLVFRKDNPQMADVFFVDHVMSLELQPASLNTYVFHLASGDEISCMPNVDSCTKVCNALNIPAESGAPILVDLLKHVEKMNQKAA